MLLALAPIVQAAEGRIRRSKVPPIAGEYIVVLNDDVKNIPATASDVARKHQGQIRGVWKDAVRGFHVAMTEGRALAMSHDPRVKWVEENAPIFMSAVQTTNTVPGCSAASCTHNRFWHLDRIDAASAAQDNTFKSCSTGDGVRIYIVDSGVHRNHSEFGTKLLNGVQVPRVRDGFNATLRYDQNGVPLTDEHSTYPEPLGDYRNPPYQPCGATVAGLTPGAPTNELVRYNQEIGEGGHGTSVASIAAGDTSGVAQDAWIVPVKIFRCDGFEARNWQPSTTYAAGDRVGMFTTQWVAQQGGASGTSSSVLDPADGAISHDGGVVWKTVQRPSYDTVADAISGVNWILSEDNPDLGEPGVVNMSFFLSGATTDDQTAFETGVDALLDAGLIVVAAANNQGVDACTLIPSRMSPGNTNTAVANTVVTVGGTMIRNNPEVNSQNVSIFRGDGSGGSGSFTTEPIPAPGSTPVDARWVCGDGDSSACSSSGVPASNFGACVSVFAPAKNIASARLGTTTTYRDRLGKFSDVPRPAASGTSFASPAVAGIAALFLQHAPSATSSDFHVALELNGAGGQMENSTAAPLNGSPNLMARAVGLFAYKKPTHPTVTEGSSVTLDFPVSGPGTKSYQWYLGTPGNTSQSTAVGTDQPSKTFVPPASGTYWVRVTASSCADALNTVDSSAFNVTVNDLPIAPPATVTATTSSSSTSVNLSWLAAENAVSYEVERSTTFGGTYTTVATVTGLTHTDTPPVTSSYNTYVYRVRSKDAGNDLSVQSVPDYATVRTTALFANEPLALYTTVLNPLHLTELRAAVNAVRAAAGLGAITGATPAALNAAELNAIRDALDAARLAMGLPEYPFSADIDGGGYLRLLHFTEMRNSVK